MILCILIMSELLHSRLCHVIIQCASRGTLLRCPVRPRVIIMVHSSCFPLRTVITMLSLSRESVYKLLHCRYVGAVFVISTDILILFYGAHYYGRWFDDDMMFPTTTADYGLRLPSFSPVLLSSGRCRDPGSTSLMMDCCAIPGLSTTPMMGLSSPAPDSPLS